MPPKRSSEVVTWSRRKCRPDVGKEFSVRLADAGDTGEIMEMRFVAVNLRFLEKIPTEKF
jgi:hypothetical protein